MNLLITLRRYFILYVSLITILVPPPVAIGSLVTSSTMSSSARSSSSSTSSISSETTLRESADKLLQQVGGNLNKAFVEAIRRNNLTLVQYYLTQGADLSKHTGGFLPLHQAVKNGFIDIVCTLIERHADINARTNENFTDNGHTALHLAAAHGHEKIVERLLQCGAEHSLQIEDVDGFQASSFIGYTPLHSAAENDHSKVVDVLIQHNAHIEARDSIGRTPLHIAAGKGRGAVVEILCEKRAQINTPSKTGLMPLHVAAQNNHFVVAQMLIKAGASTICDDVPLERPESSGTRTTIQILCSINNASLQNLNEVLLKTLKALLSVKDFDFYPLYSTLIKYQELLPTHHKELVTLLLSRTPVPADVANIILEYYDCLDISTSFFEKTARFTNLNKELERAIFSKNSVRVKECIAQGADVRMPYKNGLSPLQSAVQKGDVDVINELITGGADVNAVAHWGYKQGTTALHLAAEHGHAKVVELLLKHSELKATAIQDGTTPLHACVYLDVQDLDGLTPLHVAAKKGHKEVVKTLLGKKANVDTRDIQSKTPLHLAVEACHEDVTELLIQAGAPTTDVVPVDNSPISKIIQLLLFLGKKDAQKDLVNVPQLHSKMFSPHYRNNVTTCDSTIDKSLEILAQHEQSLEISLKVYCGMPIVLAMLIISYYSRDSEACLLIPADLFMLTFKAALYH